MRPAPEHGRSSASSGAGDSSSVGPAGGRGARGGTGDGDGLAAGASAGPGVAAGAGAPLGGVPVGGGRGVAAPLAARVDGIDLARFLALVGMMATHLWIGWGVGETPVFVDAIGGKAAALFAVLAGVGITFTTRTALAAGDARAARLNVFGRGLALVVIGLTLGLAPAIILVIIAYYGLTFWLAIPFLRVRSRYLLLVAGVWAVAWPPLSMLLRGPFLEVPEVGSASWLDLAHPLELVRGLFASGAYPALTWIVYVLVGMVVGRVVTGTADFGSVREAGAKLAAVGTVVAAGAYAVSALLLWPLGAVGAYAEAERITPLAAQETLLESSYGVPTDTGWWFLVSPAPHSGTAFDLAITAGIAVAVIGLLLLLGTFVRGTGRKVLSPVLAAGGAPLTVYSVHVFVAAASAVFALNANGTIPREYADGFPWWFLSPWIWLCHIAGAILIGWILVLLRVRGPLERLVGWTGRAFASIGRRGETGRGAATGVAARAAGAEAVGTGPAGAWPTGAGQAGQWRAGTGPAGAGSVVTGLDGAGPVGAGPVGTGLDGAGPLGAGPVGTGPSGSPTDVGRTDARPSGAGSSSAGASGAGASGAGASSWTRATPWSSAAPPPARLWPSEPEAGAPPSNAQASGAPPSGVPSSNAEPTRGRPPASPDRGRPPTDPGAPDPRNPRDSRFGGPSPE